MNVKTKNIFSSTFCSSDVLEKIIHNFKNSILIIDEFHNLSYNDLINANSSMFKLLTSNDISKKLFMSATPKIYEIKEEIKTHSIDNFEQIFGKIFYSYDFEMAVKNKYVNDYRVIIPNYEIENDKYDFIYSNMLYHGYKKCMIYCKSIEETLLFQERIIKCNEQKFNLNIFIKTITNRTTFIQRNKILESFIKNTTTLNFIISVHTMDECIDIPKCDCVYITYNVSNPINIIQRISRCLRIYPNKIISGIFLWCSKYTDLKKINNIISSHGINILNNVYIKSECVKKLEKLKFEFINSISDEEIKELKECKKVIYEDLTDEFIKDFYYAGDEQFFINLERVANHIGTEKKKLKQTLLNSYVLDKEWIIKKTFIDKKISKSNPEIILLNVNCFKNLIMNSKTKFSNNLREKYLKLEQLQINKQGKIIEDLKNKLKEYEN